MNDAEQVRLDNIDYFLQGDRVWPPNWIAYESGQRFGKALREVFRRLEDDDFDKATNLWFVLDNGFALALNVPQNIAVLATSLPFTYSCDTIYLTNRAWQLNDTALVGLLAHEIAHSFVERQSHSENEEAADALVRKWGFRDELDAINAAT